MIKNTQQYLEKIQKTVSKESSQAAALIWYLSEANPNNEVHIDEVISTFVTSGFKSSVNKARLIKNLGKEPGIIKGIKKGTYRCSLKHSVDLENRFSVDEQHSKPKLTYNFIEQGTFPNNRAYLVRITEQINGTYEYEFYDGCAVLMRRLMESLLIEVFEYTGQAQLIRDANGHYKMLNGIINSLGGSRIRFARGIAKTIENVKKVGDNAAHGRAHTTKKNDIDDLKIEYRKLISELKLHSNIV